MNSVNRTDIIVNRMKKDVFKMQQENEEMLASKHGESNLYDELRKAINICKDIKTIIDKMEREVS